MSFAGGWTTCAASGLSTSSATSRSSTSFSRSISTISAFRSKSWPRPRVVPVSDAPPGRIADGPFSARFGTLRARLWTYLSVTARTSFRYGVPRGAQEPVSASHGASSRGHETLHPLAVEHLARIDVPRRVHCNHVKTEPLAAVLAHAAHLADDFAILAIQKPDVVVRQI